MLLDRIIGQCKSQQPRHADKDALDSLRATSDAICAESERRKSESKHKADDAGADMRNNGGSGSDYYDDDNDNDNDDGSNSNSNCSAPQNSSAAMGLSGAGAGISNLISSDDLQSLDDGELADVSRMVWIAEYLAARHYDKQHMRVIMEPLVDSIRGSADSIDLIEGDVHRLLLSAQTSLGRLQDMHIEMCEGNELDAGAGVMRAGARCSDSGKSDGGADSCILPSSANTTNAMRDIQDAAIND